MKAAAGEETSTAIHADKFSVRKGKLEILRDVSFTIERGSLVGLIGPSGSGKTTLMRAIIGAQIGSKGLKILGLPAGHRINRHKIGYMSQSPSVYIDLTVAQNVSYFAKIMNVPKSDPERVIKEVDLSEHKNKLARNLSGGQLSRLSLAVALLGQPELLVLDEPTVGLDPILRRDLWELFAHLQDEGRTLLISSHVMDEAERCSELLLLRDGKLLAHEKTDQLLKKTKTYSVESAFLSLVEKGAT